MSNNAQAKALADSLAPLILEALKPAISEHIETQIGGLKKKNAELLDKTAGQKRTHDRNGKPFDRWYTKESNHDIKICAFGGSTVAGCRQSDEFENAKQLAKWSRPSPPIIIIVKLIT